MRITFLGHQGWHIEHDGRGILLDPILEAIGNGAARMPIWPRRRLDFTRLQPFDTVILSHEHADHFSLETLLALPRHCRIFVSDLSSTAMTTAITSLGFKIERFTALRSLVVNGITLTPLPGLFNTLEPDTYGLLMQDPSGASFLTTIDTVAHPQVFGWLQAHCPRRTLDNLTNNFIEPRQPLLEDPAAYTKSRRLVTGTALDFVRDFSPRRAVLSGQGWCYQGAKSHLNHSFFSVDNAWLTRTLNELAPQIEWWHGGPGMRFTLHGEQLQVDTSAAIGPLDSPSRELDLARRSSEPFPPWSELRTLPRERLDAVRDFVRERFGLGVGAHAPRLMEAVYYLKSQDIGPVTAALGLSVRNGEQRWLYELDYGQLTWREIKPGRGLPPAVGVEIWAADLELMIGAREEAFTIYESAVQSWSHVPHVIDTAALMEIFLWFTPRFRPQEFTNAYRAELARLGATTERGAA